MTCISDDKCERTLTCLATLATDNIYTEVGDKNPRRQDLHAKIPDSAPPPPGEGWKVALGRCASMNLKPSTLGFNLGCLPRVGKARASLALSRIFGVNLNGHSVPPEWGLLGVIFVPEKEYRRSIEVQGEHGGKR